MATDQSILEAAAQDGSIDYSKWSELLESLLSLLDNTVSNDFPLPIVPPTKDSGSAPVPDSSFEETPQSPNVHRSSEQGDKEAAPLRSNSHPCASNGSGTAPQVIIPNSQPSEPSSTPGDLPPQLVTLYTRIQNNLKSSFSSAPPFTIQRLIELILRPKAHYRTLPSYLRALDRVISVSSTAATFPLPLISSGEDDGSSYLSSSTGVSRSDDFNGAALTRIPWLRDTASVTMSSDRPLTTDLRTESTSVIDGPNGAGSIETVTVSINGVSSTSRSDMAPKHEPFLTSKRLEEAAEAVSSSTTRQEDDGSEERVHARGPEEIGMEDMGPQHMEQEGHVFDAEAALGRPGEGEKFSAEIRSPRPEKALDSDIEVADIEVNARDDQQAPPIEASGDGESKQDDPKS